VGAVITEIRRSEIRAYAPDLSVSDLLSLEPRDRDQKIKDQKMRDQGIRA
jgi:hypothetical protein